MRVTGKVLRLDTTREPLGVEYKIGDWTLRFGPSIGVQGMFYVALMNPRGWETLDWVKTRREVFEFTDTQMTKYRAIFPTI